MAQVQTKRHRMPFEAHGVLLSHWNGQLLVLTATRILTRNRRIRRLIAMLRILNRRLRTSWLARRLRSGILALTGVLSLIRHEKSPVSSELV
jgi:hypothetical protein